MRNNAAALFRSRVGFFTVSAKLTSLPNKRVFWVSTLWPRIRGRPGTRAHPDGEGASGGRSTHIGGRKCDLQPGGDALFVHLVPSSTQTGIQTPLSPSSSPSC